MSELKRILITLVSLALFGYLSSIIFKFIGMKPSDYIIYIIFIITLGLFFGFLPKKIGTMFE